jgi:hypothetical protein
MFFSPSRAVDVNEADSFGYTPLHFAALLGMPSLAVQLLQRGRCDLERETHDVRIIGSCESGGRTPLHLACLRGHTDIVTLLLQYGANTRAVDWDGCTAFDLACLNARTETVDCLRATGRAPTGTGVERLEDYDRMAKEKAVRASAAARLEVLQNPTGLFLAVHVAKSLLSGAECDEVSRSCMTCRYETFTLCGDSAIRTNLILQIQCCLSFCFSHTIRTCIDPSECHCAHRCAWLVDRKALELRHNRYPHLQRLRRRSLPAPATFCKTATST